MKNRAISTQWRGKRWVWVGLVFLIRCGGAGTEMNGSASVTAAPVVENETSAPISGEILEITVGEEGISIPDSILDGEQDIIVMLAGMNGGGQSQGFEVGFADSPSALRRVGEFNLDRQLKRTSDDSFGVTESLHENLRRLENKIPATADIPAMPGKSVKWLTSAIRAFKVLKSFGDDSNYTTVAGRLAFAGTYYELYVDERDLNAFTEDDLSVIAENFDALIPEERNFFGEESDVDNDGRFTVLLTREVNGLGQKYGGIVTGFFYATDLFDKSAYPNSNEMEILYGLVPDPDSAYGTKIPYDLAMTNIIPGVLTHEFQHMINFNRHHFVAGNAAEASWLNEGLSHLAEDLETLDSDGYLAGSALENPSRSARFLKNIATTCFSCGAGIAQRGGAYLFLRYLYEQAERGNLPGPADGREFISQLLFGEERDLANLTAAIGGDADDTAVFEEAFARFGLALYLSRTENNTDEQLEITGINLRAPQDDNRGTNLNGPALTDISSLPYVDTLTGYSFNYLSIPGALLAKTQGITVSVTDGTALRAFIIQ